MPSADKTEPTFTVLLWRGFLSFLNSGERMALCSSSIFHGCFTLKPVAFSNTVWLFKDSFFRLSEKSVKLTKCFEKILVLRPVNILVFLVMV
jgi:hypothetical protein